MWTDPARARRWFSADLHSDSRSRAVFICDQIADRGCDRCACRRDDSSGVLGRN